MHHQARDRQHDQKCHRDRDQPTQRKSECASDCRAAPREDRAREQAKKEDRARVVERLEGTAIGAIKAPVQGDAAQKLLKRGNQPSGEDQQQDQQIGSQVAQKPICLKPPSPGPTP